MDDIVNVKAKAPDGTKTAIMVTAGVFAGGAMVHLFTQQGSTSTPAIPCPAHADPEECP